MSEPKSVWMLTAGNYSDYRVVGLFSTKENAELAKDIEFPEEHSYDNLQISEVELDTGIENYNKGLSLFEVLMKRDGSNFCYKETGLYTTSEIHLQNKEIRMVVWAKDETQAVKIVNEKRIQLIAENIL